MFQNIDTKSRRRGRPRSRSDSETRRVIVDAAATCFRSYGYAGASMNDIAAEAGVSTRTMYRLFPGKADLLAGSISLRISEFLLKLDRQPMGKLSLREGLVRLLTAYGMLTLSTDAIQMAKIVTAESSRFPEVALAFYERAVLPTNLVLEDWLRVQCDNGRLAISNPKEASGILRGMMIMEPQRASLLRQRPPLEPEQVAIRAEECVDYFLKGCARDVGKRSDDLAAKA